MHSFEYKKIFKNPETGIYAIIFLTHGWLLISDWIIWDDWMLTYMFSHDRFDYAKWLLTETGLNLTYYWFAAIGSFKHHILLAKCLSFIYMFINYFSIREIFLVIRPGDTHGARILGLLSVLAPLFSVNGALGVITYSLGYTLFLLGAYLFLVRANGSKAMWWRSASMALFFLSFNVNSLLVFFYGFVLLDYLLYRVKSEEPFIKTEIRYCLMRWYLILLPVIFWAWKEIFTPRHGEYANYNRIALHTKTVIAGFKSLFTGTLLPALTHVPASALCASGIIALFVGCYLTFFRGTSHAHDVSNPSASRISAGIGIVLGCVLLFLGAFPYIVATPYPHFASYGWGTKNNLLLNLPLAIICFFTIRFIDLAVSRFQLSNFLFPLVIGILVFLNIQNYARWETFSLKEKSFLTQIAENKDIDKYPILEIHEKTKIPKTIDIYPPAVWSFQIASARGRIDRFAFEIGPDGIEASGHKKKEFYRPQDVVKLLDSTTIRREFKEVDINSRQGILVLLPGKTYSPTDWSVPFSYWWLKLTDENAAKNFVRDLVRIKLHDRPMAR